MSTSTPCHLATSCFLALVPLSIAGCEPRSSVEQAKSLIDQTSVCVYSNAQEASRCRDGQLSFFQPPTFGNEQLPLLAAATYCDFNHQIVHTRGGVVCVFTSQRKAAAEQPK